MGWVEMYNSDSEIGDVECTKLYSVQYLERRYSNAGIV